MSAPNEWQEHKVMQLQREGILLVEDGNHGEYRPRTEEFGLGEFSFIRAADMDAGRVLFNSAARINSTARERIRKGIGAGGDVLLSHKGTVGKIAYVPVNAPPFVCSPQTTFWRSLDQERLDRRYLYYYLCSEEFTQQLASRKGETDMADYVSLTAQRELSVLTPPINTQRAIARILGSLDDKIELNRKMNRTLEALAQVLFRSWFVDFEPVSAKRERLNPAGMDDATAALFPEHFQESVMGPIPAGWKVIGIGDVMKNFDSKRIPLSGSQRTVRPGEYPYYGAASVMDYIDDYIFDGVYLLVGEDGSVTDNNDMAITQYVWGKFWVNNHAHVLQGANGISTEHLMLAFQENPILPYVTGAVQPKLNQGNMNRFPFMLPSPEVSKAFNQIITPLYQSIRARSEESRTLVKLRDTLLPQLLSGELRVGQAEKMMEDVA